MTEVLTDEQIKAKASELSEKHNGRVFPIVFMDPDTKEQIVGYVKEPNRMTKIRAMDKSISMGVPMSAAAEILEAGLIKEESHPRLSSEKPEDDYLFMGAADACYNMIKIAVDQLKKK